MKVEEINTSSNIALSHPIKVGLNVTAAPTQHCWRRDIEPRTYLKIASFMHGRWRLREGEWEEKDGVTVRKLGKREEEEGNAPIEWYSWSKQWE